MNETAITGAGIAVLGLLAAIFAQPLATSQERVVQKLPSPLNRFYRVIGAGVPFDAPPWVAYNRIAGLLLVVFGTMVTAFTTIRP